MKKNILAVFALCAGLLAQAETFSVKSPDGKLEAVVNDSSSLTLTIKADGKVVFDAFKIGMKTDKGEFGSKSKATGSITGFSLSLKSILTNEPTEQAI